MCKGDKKNKEGNKCHLVEYMAENEGRDARLGSAAQMVHHMFCKEAARVAWKSTAAWRKHK